MTPFAGLMMVLALGAALWAQSLNDQPECVCLTDATCSPTDCTSPDNCASVQFQVPTAGTYVLKSKTVCTSTGCEKCQACVNIYQGTTFVANCHNNECGIGQCENQCRVQLTANVTYTLYVCKSYCSPFDSGDDCGGACWAVGCVYATWGIPCD